jgi:hypothetical protein
MTPLHLLADLRAEGVTVGPEPGGVLVLTLPHRFPVVMEKFVTLRDSWSGLTERP